jgi:hypothetical protein
MAGVDPPKQLYLHPAWRVLPVIDKARGAQKGEMLAW